MPIGILFYFQKVGFDFYLIDLINFSMGFRYLVITVICCVHNAFGFMEIEYEYLNHAKVFSFWDESIFTQSAERLLQEERNKKYLYLKDYKKYFESNSFSYLPFIYEISDSPLGSQVLKKENTNISSFAEKKLIFFKNTRKDTKDWKFTFCAEINELTNSSFEKSQNLSLNNFTSSFRFKDYIFSWTEFESLQIFEEENSLIPYNLLDAIKKNNFELFFQQKEIADDELHAVYLEALHNSIQPHLSKASAMSFSDLATYLLIGGLVFLFVSKYSNDGVEGLRETTKIKGCSKFKHYKTQNKNYKDSLKRE
tara:strand:- start:3897 stop:4826 length:930 start_codon:yes stop_codon:yes gene_type:complete